MHALSTVSIQDGCCQACLRSEPYLIPPANEPGPGTRLTEQVHKRRPAFSWGSAPTPIQDPSGRTKVQLGPCPPLQRAVAGGAGQPVATWYGRRAG